MAADPVAFKKTKHILRAAHELRDRVARCVFAPKFVESAQQLADVLTKSLRPLDHARLVTILMHVPRAVASQPARAFCARACRVRPPLSWLRFFILVVMIVSLAAMPPSWPSTPEDDPAADPGDPPPLRLDPPAQVDPPARASSPLECPGSPNLLGYATVPTADPCEILEAALAAARRGDYGHDDATLRALARATGVLAARSSFLPHVRAVVESIVAPVSDVPMAQLTGQAWQWRKRVLGLFAMCNQATMHAADALLRLRCMGGLSRSDASFLLPPGCGV